jgi:phosphoglycolate phosphatase-like HAD superfamily hydrolase
MRNDNVALFDLDGTLCDYDSAMVKSLNSIRAPSEPELIRPPHDNLQPYMQARIDLICADELWWENLPKFELGFKVLAIAEFLKYRPMILTQGPKRNPYAWSGKKKWIDKYLGNTMDVTITRDKGLVYGKMLVDDFPRYIKRWLEWRKNGLVIMPANEGNKNFKHDQVIRFDGTNEDEVFQAMNKRISK